MVEPFYEMEPFIKRKISYLKINSAYLTTNVTGQKCKISYLNINPAYNDNS